MKRFKVHFAAEAWVPVQAQVRYTAIENHAPENAVAWLTRLLEAIDTLELMPQRYGLDEHQTDMHGADVHRMVFELTYLVFYTIDVESHRVNVVSFRQGVKEGR